MNKFDILHIAVKAIENHGYSSNLGIDCLSDGVKITMIDRLYHRSVTQTISVSEVNQSHDPEHLIESTISDMIAVLGGDI